MRAGRASETLLVQDSNRRFRWEGLSLYAATVDRLSDYKRCCILLRHSPFGNKCPESGRVFGCIGNRDQLLPVLILEPVMLTQPL